MWPSTPAQLRMLSQFVNVLDVTVLPTHVPSAEEQQRPELFAARVRAQYVAATGYRAVEQGQREFIALCKVRTCHSHALKPCRGKGVGRQSRTSCASLVGPGLPAKPGCKISGFSSTTSPYLGQSAGTVPPRAVL